MTQEDKKEIDLHEKFLQHYIDHKSVYDKSTVRQVAETWLGIRKQLLKVINIYENSHQEVKSGETVFRKVSVEERLPTKSDYYFTDRGHIIFGTNTGKFQESKEYYPKYWLEEIPLPTQSAKSGELTDAEIEKEGEKRFGEIKGGGSYHAARPEKKSLFIKGAKWVRDNFSPQSGLNKEEIIKWIEGQKEKCPDNMSGITTKNALELVEVFILSLSKDGKAKGIEEVVQNTNCPYCDKTASKRNSLCEKHWEKFSDI